MPVEDSALIQRVLDGHQEDFETLVERYQKILYAFVYGQLRDKDATEEVVQATFVRAYTHLAGFRSDSTFKTWLHGIALNECRTLFRQRKVRRDVPLAEVPEERLATDRNDEGESSTGSELAGLLQHLPPRQRTVVNLRIFSDLPFAEIARIEGISENAAKVNYHHGIVRLKRWLTETC